MSEEITDLTTENFDEMTAKGNWVIDFWAEWCGPCRMLKPIFEETAKEMKGKKVKFGKINIDNQSEIAEAFEVMSIPTLIFLENQKQINRVTGLMQKDELVHAVKSSFRGI